MRIPIATILSFCIVSFCMAGCTSMYGNHTQLSDYTIIVTDALHNIEKVALPAKTHFYIVHDIADNDTFGGYLIAELRARGYAVSEYSKHYNRVPDDVPFAYTLSSYQHLIYLKVTVGDKVMSGAYIHDSNGVKPSGSWSARTREHNGE